MDLIYFNNNRTTRMDEEVGKTISTFTGLTPEQKEEAVEKASFQFSRLLNCSPEEIIFTTGTSESLTLGMLAAFETNQNRGKHVITNKTEHPVILKCCDDLVKKGATVTYLNVDREGRMDTEEFRSALRPDTILVSIMAANNETGVVQPIEYISEICKKNGIIFFSDASQYVGKLRCDVHESGFSVIGFGAHKMHGPKGIGALFIDRRYRPMIEYVRTNQQEVPPVLIAGFGKTADISFNSHWETSAHISKLKNYFEHQLLDIEGLRINGSTKHRLYNTSNLTFPQHVHIASLRNKYDFADNQNYHSHVLKAMGLNDVEIKNSCRFSFGKYNTMEEVKAIVEDILALSQDT
jgi:cysteine desulfurase